MPLVENAVTEFKREYTSDIIKTVIAYSNTSGGALYIGIDNSGCAYGVEDIEGTMLKATSVKSITSNRRFSI